jgi:hypothetical protein
LKLSAANPETQASSGFRCRFRGKSEKLHLKNFPTI